MTIPDLDLEDWANRHGVRFFLVSFSDFVGTVRSKLVPASAINEAKKAGAGFAGFATWLDMTPADPDILAIPDPASLTVLPWKPQVAWVAADLWMDGQPVAQSPRQILKGAIAAAEEKGYSLKTGVECEFFVLDPEGKGPADPFDRQAKPCYDQLTLMRRFDLVAEISQAMESLGWGPYQTDHEDANGQFEMNWRYADALVTADRQTFFKQMVKSMAEQRGLRATFMPKPFDHLTGNGCHTHLSLWDRETNANLFDDPAGELGLSKTAYEFMGGMVHSARALCAFTNPTVNSYRRLHAASPNSGATWSPAGIGFAGNNRTPMIRIPDAGRFELRLPDGSCNPYLAAAAILHAGLDGLAHHRDPGTRIDGDLYTSAEPARLARPLPDNMLEAIAALETSKVYLDAFGETFVASYLKVKRNEWRLHQSHVSAWERRHTLDC